MCIVYYNLANHSLLFIKDRKINGETCPGRIVVHDRNKVESEILPRYFNHSSFASLRRQLNYFSFSRIGKDNQHATTYFNDQVCELNDILSLRRRSVGTNAEHPGEMKKEEVITEVLQHPVTLSASKPVHISSKKEPTPMVTCTKKKRISKGFINSTIPVIHVHRSKKPRINVEDAESQSCNDVGSSIQRESSSRVLELEQSMNHILSSPHSSFRLPGTVFHSVSNNSLELPEHKDPQTKDADVLDGCEALLALGS
jgi:hypothetical protein